MRPSKKRPHFYSLAVRIESRHESVVPLVVFPEGAYGGIETLSIWLGPSIAGTPFSARDKKVGQLVSRHLIQGAGYRPKYWRSGVGKA